MSAGSTAEVQDKDPDYIRKLDSLARFYNSQATAHAGYLLSSIVAYLAFINICLAIAVKIDQSWTAIVVLVLFFAVLSCFLLKIRTPLLPKYNLSRIQYYMELSQIVWEHMKVNNPDMFDHLRTRTMAPYTSIQASVQGLFEARLFRSLWRKEKKEEEPREVVEGVNWQQRWLEVYSLLGMFKNDQGQTPKYDEIIHSDVYYNAMAGREKTYYGRPILRISKRLPSYDYADLLWTAYRGTVREYELSDPKRMLWSSLFPELRQNKDNATAEK